MENKIIYKKIYYTRKENMLAEVKSIALNGLQGYQVKIQTDVSAGIPVFEIVGLPDTSIKESKERVKIAIRNTVGEFLSRKIIVNLAPANIRKEGSIFDLPIAIGILMAMGKISEKKIEDTIFIGELALGGTIEKVNGVLPICIEARKLGIKKVILPKENAKEAAIIEDLKIIPISTLEEAIQYLNGKIKIFNQEDSNFNSKINSNYQFDFSEIKGQENVKRALEVTAAGGHNCLLIRLSRLWKNHDGKSITKYLTRAYF